MTKKVNSETYLTALLGTLWCDIILIIVLFGFKNLMCVFIPVLFLFCVTMLIMPFLINGLSIELEKEELATHIEKSVLPSV